MSEDKERPGPEAGLKRPVFAYPKTDRSALGYLVQVIKGADMRCQHTGLGASMKKEGKVKGELKPGQFVLFINHDENKLKLVGANNCIVYLATPDGRPIQPEAIINLPSLFCPGSHAQPLEEGSAEEGVTRSRRAVQWQMYQILICLAALLVIIECSSLNRYSATRHNHQQESDRWKNKRRIAEQDS